MSFIIRLPGDEWSLYSRYEGNEPEPYIVRAGTVQPRLSVLEVVMQLSEAQRLPWLEAVSEWAHKHRDLETRQVGEGAWKRADRWAQLPLMAARRAVELLGGAWRRAS